MALKINKNVAGKPATKKAGVSSKLAVPPGVASAEPDNASKSAVVAYETKEYPDGSMVSSEKVLKEVPPIDAPAYVSVSIGLTRNLGNYESVRVNIGLSMPCPPTPEEIDNAYHEAKGWVDTRVEMVSKEIDDEIGG